jgi:hypothetical protein
MHYTTETFFRGEPIETKQQQMPLDYYRQITGLLRNSGHSCVFVPIRTMQYMAVIDAEEVIFVSMYYRSQIQFAWRYFDLREMTDLTRDTVRYQFEYYDPEALMVMARVPREFGEAMALFDERHARSQPPAKVLKLRP